MQFKFSHYSAKMNHSLCQYVWLIFMLLIFIVVLIFFAIFTLPTLPSFTLLTLFASFISLQLFVIHLYPDMSHCDHRLWLELNGPELHIYNRSELYARLEKAFGLENQLGVGKGAKEEDEEEEEQQHPPRQARDMSFWQDWRDLIPVIKIELNMASCLACSYLLFILEWGTSFVFVPYLFLSLQFLCLGS